MNMSIEPERMRLRKAVATHVIHCYRDGIVDRVIKICGTAYSGKTELAFAYIQHARYQCYFSFRGLDNKNALTAFKHAVSAWDDISSANSWTEAFQLLLPFFKRHTTRLVLDDMEQFKCGDVVLDAIEKLFESLTDMKNLFFLPCRYADSFGKHETFIMRQLSYADIKKCAPALSASDCARVYALTGGLRGLLSEYDEAKLFQQNMNHWLRLDSVYYRAMLQMLSDCFRSPASYHAILYAIATGKQRLSEIAKEIGAPNNQCKKYLDALLSTCFATIKPSGGRNIYCCANSYITFWHRFLYLNASRLALDLSTFAEEIHSELNNYALESCMDYMTSRLKLVLPTDAIRLVGQAFDYAIVSGKKTILVKLPEHIEWRCTKSELDYMFDNVKLYCRVFYDAEIYVYSFHRFSNYCVEKASRLGNLHLVVG